MNWLRKGVVSTATIATGLVMAVIAQQAGAASPGAASQPRFPEGWSAKQACVIRIAGTEGTGPVLKDKPGRGGQIIEVSANFLWDRVLLRWEMDGARELTPFAKKEHSEIAVAGAVTGLAVADFTGDGQKDLAVADFLAGTVDIYRVSREAAVDRIATMRVGAGPVALAAGDFDGDGRADIATAGFYSRSISTYQGLGDGRFKPAVQAAASAALAASRLFEPAASAAVDYTALKTAVSTYSMSASTRKKLNKYVTQSENAYNGGNRRKAVSRLEKLIKQLNYNRDSQLSETNRKNLIQLAKDVMGAIMGSTGVSVTMSAAPSVIAPGATSTLTWSSTGAVAAVINQGIGAVATSGSTGVSPAGTTTYTIVVTAADATTATASATVNVGATSAIFVDMARGSDTTGDGSGDHPYQSITKGLSVATSGKTVYVFPGVYDSGIETMPLTVPDGVTLQGGSATSTVVLGGGNSAGGHTAVVLGNNTTLTGFKIKNTGGFGVWMDQTATITSCTIDVAGIDGVEVVGGANLTMSGSTVTNSTYDAVWFQDTAQGTVSSNTLQNNSMRAVAVYYTPGPLTVSSNTISGNGAGTGFDDSQVALLYASGTTITGNTITATANYVGYYGVAAYGVTSSTISSNTIGMFHYYYGYGMYFNLGGTPAATGNIVSLGFRGVRVTGTGTNPTVSSNTITGSSIGLRVSSATGTFRSNSVTGCVDRGVRISSGTPDLGTGGSPGGNTFHNLATGCSNYYDTTAGTINAIGNAWDNDPATYTTAGGCSGFDIQNNSGGTVNY